MITLKGITKIFENRVERVSALKNVNLTLEDTGMVFVNGYSGAGKSTLLSIIGGIDVASSGNVIVDNFSLKDLSSVELDRYRNNYVGFVFESIDLIENMTVEENIRVSCAFNGKEPSETQMEYLIDKFKLSSIRKRKPNQISLGQRQKVGVARALAKDPYLYLADDPTGHVDAKRADEIWAILKEISKKRLVIAVSHDSRIIEKYADRIITLENGEVVDDILNESTGKTSKAGGVKAVVSDITDISQAKSAREIISQKHKFSFKNLFWLTKNNLKFKPLRFISIILLTAFALMTFSLFTILNRFDRVEVLAKSIAQNDMEYVTFVKADGSPVTTKEYNNILVYNKALYGKDFQPGQLIEFNGRLMQDGSYTEYKVNYVLNQVYTQETQTFLGQKILYGSRPQGELDWMISDYVAEQIKRGLGLQDQSEVLGKEFNSSSYNLNANKKITIVGIYDTDYEKYIDSETFMSNGYKSHELDYNEKYVYSVAIVGDEYVDAIISANSKNSSYVITAVDNYSGSIYSSGAELLVRKKSGADSDVVWLAGGDKSGVSLEGWDGLDENGANSQIILSLDFFNDYFGKIGAFTGKYAYGLTEDYLNQNGFALNDGVENVLKGGYSLNITMKFNGQYEKTFWVAGVTNHNELIISNNDYDNIFSETKFKTTGVIIKAGSSQQMMEELIVELENNGFQFTSTTSAKIDQFDNNISIFKSVFLACSILFACFVAVLIYYFVYTLISERKHAIGIMRTFGARGRDVLKIFLLTGAFIVLGIMIAGSAGTLIASLIGNLYARSAMATMFNVFNVKLIDFVLLFGISAFMIFVGTCVPIAKYIKDDPYNNIKGR